MRILNISFKNINSLEGEGRVDFDRGPIADSGVFAITGPNGSGKTSILDVITLGLYGETFRFDKPAEHVITKHATESLAQVEFALGGETFRSSWQVKRAEPMLAEMTLTRLSDEEEVLARSPNQVRQRLLELTGMDFHKFSKSMVLPQGDFAAFLNALESERMDILEKISGTELYADYRRQAETDYADAQTKVTLLEQDIGLIPLLPAEALEAAEHDLQDFAEQAAGLKSEQDHLQQQLDGLQNLAAIEKQRTQLEQQMQGLERQIEQHRQDLQLIAASQPATSLKNDLETLDNKQAQLSEVQATLATYRNELAMLQQQLAADHGGNQADIGDRTLSTQKQAIDTLKLKISELKLELPRENESAQAIQHQLAGDKAALAKVESWMQAHQADASLSKDFPEVAKLRNLRSELTELTAKLKSQNKWSKHTTDSLKKNQTSLAATKSRIEELKTQLAADQETMLALSQGKSFDELKDLHAEQQARANDFQEMLELASINARLTKKGLFGWFGRSKSSDLPEEAQLQARADALRQEMSDAENIGKVLEQAIVNENLIKKMNTERTKLVDGKPCPLCGSLQHPYVTKPPVFSDAKKALTDQRGKLQALKSAIDSVNNQLTAARKRSSQLTAKEKFLQQKHSEWIVLANRLNTMRTKLDIDNISLQKQLVEEETEELNKVVNLLKDYGQLQRNVDKAKAELNGKQALLEKLSAASEELNNLWNNRPPEFIELEQRFTSCKAEEQALTAKLEKQLTLLGEKLPGKGKENALFDRLTSRRQDYQIRELRQKGLQEDMGALQEKLQTCQAAILRYQQEMTANLEALRSEEWLGLHLTVLEKQKLIVAQEQQLAQLEIELQAMQRNLADKIANGGYTGIEQLRSLLALIDNQPEIQRLSNERSAQLASLADNLAGIEARLLEESAGLVSTVNEADLLSAQRQIAQQIDIAEQEIRTLENKLAKQQQYRNKYQTLETELTEQRRLLSQAQAEIDLINDQQGGFRRRIQQLLIDKLLSETNRILEKISGRYYLRSTSSEHGLALEIEDTKQKNVRRLPKTLSGGESFVVSLALALALAEMANNGKAIESLFLDEGFGNLDAESLYLAMGALEGLRIQGKTVGVISHVEGVKKRIKTQIELVKKANGLSELKMVA